MHIVWIKIALQVVNPSSKSMQYFDIVWMFLRNKLVYGKIVTSSPFPSP